MEKELELRQAIIDSIENKTGPLTVHYQKISTPDLLKIQIALFGGDGTKEYWQYMNRDF